MSKFKCPFCKKVYTAKVDLAEHLEAYHNKDIPEGWSGLKYIFYMKHGRTTGKCIVCGKPTKFNEVTGKPYRLCENSNCTKSLREKAKANMIKVYGKETLLNDPEFQVKMLGNRKISKDYEWSDGSIKRVVGSFEYDGMEKLDLLFHFPSEDVIVPAPFSIEYMYEGKKHFYIPDVYIQSLNILIEFKDGGNNPNTHPKIQAIDKKKEKAKEEALKKLNKYHYVKIENKQYGGFLELLIKLKNTDEIDDSKEKYFIVENTLINEGVVNKIDTNYVSKNKISLSRFNKEKINKTIIDKYKNDNKFLKHVDYDDNGYIWFDKDSVVGIVTVDDKKDYNWISAIEINQNYKGHNLGKQILDFAVKKLKGNALSVNKKNEVAIKMYKKYGFKIYKEDKNMYYMCLESVIGESTLLTEKKSRKAKTPKCIYCGSDDVGIYIKGEPVYICNTCNKYIGSVPMRLHENGEIEVNKDFLEIVMFTERAYPIFTEVGILINDHIYVTRSDCLTTEDIEDIILENTFVPNFLTKKQVQIIKNNIDNYLGVWNNEDILPVNSPMVLIHDILYNNFLEEPISYSECVNIFDLNYYFDNPKFNHINYTEKKNNKINENALKQLQIGIDNVSEDIDYLLENINDEDLLNNTNDIIETYSSLLKEATLTTKERNKLDDDKFGIPEQRKFPLIDKSHIIMAIRYFYSCDLKYKEELAKRINKAAKTFGLKINISTNNPFYKYADNSIIKESVYSISDDELKTLENK